MMRCFLFLLLLAGMVRLFSGEPDHLRTAAAVVISENQFRKLGGGSDEKIIQKLFSEDAGKKWRAEISSVFSREQIADFFTGTLVFQGPIRRNSVIFAYYNCWWDAVLLCEGFLEQVSVDGKKLMIVKINDFQFLDGALYRREDGRKNRNEKSSETVPLIVQNMRKLQLSEAEFQKRSELYSKNGLSEEFPEKENLRLLVMHSAARMKRKCLLLQNTSAFRESEGLKKLLAGGNEQHFKLLFPTPLSLLMGKNYCSLPSEIRSAFRLYECHLSPQGRRPRLYIFLNRKAPREAAVFHLEQNPRKNQFHYLDTGNYTDFLKLCDQAEKAGKERRK